MKSIKMKNCKFYVIKEKRTIICVIPYTKNMLLDYMAKYLNQRDFSIYYGATEKLDNKLRMPSSFTGKAVCAEEDEWDEEFGKNLAFSRAKKKCYDSLIRRITLLVEIVSDRFEDMITVLDDYCSELN